MEEVPDVLEDSIDGLLHLYGEGVALEPGIDEDKGLGEVKEEREVVSNNHSHYILSDKLSFLISRILGG